MSDRVTQSYHESGERAREPVHPYQSLWVSRWAGPSCSLSLQEQNQFGFPRSTDEVDHGTKKLHLANAVQIASDTSDSVKEVKPINYKIVKESRGMSPRNLGNDTPDSQDYPSVDISQTKGIHFGSKHDQETNDTNVLKRKFSQYVEHGIVAFPTSRRAAVAPLKTEASTRECHTEHQPHSQSPKDLVKSHMIFGSSLAFTSSSHKNFTGTESLVFPKGLDLGECRFDRGRSSEPSLIRRQEKVSKLRSILASKKHSSATSLTILEHNSNYQSDDKDLGSEQKMEKCSTSGKFSPFSGKGVDSSMFFIEPSTNSSPQAFCKEKHQMMQIHSGVEISPSWSSPPEKTENLHCFVDTMPNSMHEVKTMRICTSVDGVSGNCSKISHKTQSMVLSKRTDVDLYKENHVFMESVVHGKQNKNLPCQLHGFSQLCGHSNQGEALCKGKEHVQGVDAFEAVSKNELSAETETMDIATFKENHVSGVDSFPSKKAIGTNLPPGDATGLSGGEVQRKRPVPVIPDINVEPDLSVEENSMDTAVPSTSKTQSFDINLLHAGYPSNGKADPWHLEHEWSSRWINRLKSNTSGPVDSFTMGTKSLNLDETTSNEKVNKLFGITNSELTAAKSDGKELMVLDQKAASVRNGNEENGDNITLSHFWIQRWLRKIKQGANPQNKPEAVVICDPQSSNVVLEKQQYPSIGAMALMGKAFNGFQPCEFQNKGTFIIWNDKID